MYDEKCQCCEKRFWTQEKGQGICNYCKEKPNRDLNRTKAVKQTVDYITQCQNKDNK